jgi:hypothetical protein
MNPFIYKDIMKPKVHRNLSFHWKVKIRFEILMRKRECFVSYLSSLIL